MRFVQIILLATVTALVSATPVPGLPNYRELADYLQEPDNAFEGSHEMAQAVYDACVMRYLQSDHSGPEAILDGPGELFHAFCVNEVERLTGLKSGFASGLERARELKELGAKLRLEREQAAARDGTGPGTAVPQTVPAPKPAEVQQDEGLNAFKLNGLQRAYNALSKVHVGPQFRGAPTPVGGWAPSLPNLAW